MRVARIGSNDSWSQQRGTNKSPEPLLLSVERCLLSAQHSEKLFEFYGDFFACVCVFLNFFLGRYLNRKTRPPPRLARTCRKCEVRVIVIYDSRLKLIRATVEGNIIMCSRLGLVSARISFVEKPTILIWVGVTRKFRGKSFRCCYDKISSRETKSFAFSFFSRGNFFLIQKNTRQFICNKIVFVFRRKMNNCDLWLFYHSFIFIEYT